MINILKAIRTRRKVIEEIDYLKVQHAKAKDKFSLSTKESKRRNLAETISEYERQINLLKSLL